MSQPVAHWSAQIPSSASFYCKFQQNNVIKILQKMSYLKLSLSLFIKPRGAISLDIKKQIKVKPDMSFSVETC